MNRCLAIQKTELAAGHAPPSNAQPIVRRLSGRPPVVRKALPQSYRSLIYQRSAMNMFTNMRIGNRLGLGFAVIVVLTIVITSIGVWRLYTISQTTRYLMTVPLAKERMISDWYRHLTNG